MKSLVRRGHEPRTPGAVLRPPRLLTLVDEYTREWLAIDVARRTTSEDVLERLTELFIRRGVPDHIRSDIRP